MTRRIAMIVLACIACGHAAWAHRIDEYLQATIVSLYADRAEASMRLIPGVRVAPAVIAAIDADHDGIFSATEKKAYAERVLGDLSFTVDGKQAAAVLDAYSMPDPAQLRDGLGEITIRYHLDLQESRSVNRTLILTNRHLSAGSVYLINAEVPQDNRLHIVGQKRNEQQSVYEIDYEQRGNGVQTTGSRWSLNPQAASLFRLGMRHIAEGTDHLMFLLVLLLPAPLAIVGSRWNGVRGVRASLAHIFKIVTAFTVGHSLTLSLGAFHLMHLPGRPVEILIAVSILVSAVHALRPIFPGREAWVAALFGLVHGLAFAATLERLGLSRWERVEGVLAFNLGIEAMQMILVGLILPSLLLISRTRAYSAVRISGALVAAAASLAWIAERMLHVSTPVDAVANALAQRWVALACLLFFASLASYVFAERAASKTAQAAAALAGHNESPV